MYDDKTACIFSNLGQTRLSHLNEDPNYLIPLSKPGVEKKNELKNVLHITPKMFLFKKKIQE